MDARKPRLTTQLLDDLAVAIEALDGEIAYLAEALGRKDMPLTDRLRDGFKAKHTSLVRSREWLSRHIEATRSQRADGVTQPDPLDADSGADYPAPTRHQNQSDAPAQSGVPTQAGLNFQ